MRRPNFLHIITDQQRCRDLGCYGHEIIRTPNIDRLAGEGVRFDNAFTPHPVCGPARRSLITGLWPSAMRMLSAAMGERGNLPRSLPTLPALLAANGYATAAVGKLHLSEDEPYRSSSREVRSREWIGRSDMRREGRELPMPYHGFEHVRLSAKHLEIGNYDHVDDVRAHDPSLLDKVGPQNALEPPKAAYQSWKSAVPKEWYSTNWVTEQALRFLERKDDRPFYLHVGYFDPHHPFCPPAPYCDMYPRDRVHSPVRREGELARLPEPFWPWARSDERGRSGVPADAPGGSGYVLPDEQRAEIVALYYGMLSFIDDSIGRLLRALAASGNLENTVVVYTTDHGEFLGDHWMLGKGPIHYEGLIRVPYIWWNPKRCRAGGAVDGFVSLVDHMPTVLQLAGIDDVPFMQGRSHARLLRDGGGQFRDGAFVEQDWRGIRVRTWRDRAFRISCLPDRPELGELYDIAKDPNEFENVWDEPAYRAVRERLTAKVLTEAVNVADASLFG